MYEILTAVYGVDYASKRHDIPTIVADREVLETAYTGRAEAPPLYLGIDYGSLAAHDISDPDDLNDQYPDDPQQLEQDWSDYIKSVQQQLGDILDQFGDRLDEEETRAVRDSKEGVSQQEPEKIVIHSTS